MSVNGRRGPGRPKGSVNKKRIIGALDPADAAAIRGRQKDRQAIDRLKRTTSGKLSKEIQGVIDRVAEMEAEPRELLKLLPPPDITDRRILDLKASGKTQVEIAEELGIPQQTVSDRLVDALGQLHGEIVRDVDTARTVALLRLERLLSASWPAAMAGGTEAVGNSLKILGEQAKYLGLHAPQKVDISFYIKQMAQEYGVDEAEVEAEVLKMRPELPPG